MRIGIDISQIAHEGTGVAVYVRNIVTSLIAANPKHEYILFGASLRKRAVFRAFVSSLIASKASVRLVSVPIPPTILDILWNRLHIVPIEWFIGNVDIFWSSDWTQPPLARACGITTIHDLSVLKYPGESHNVTEFRFSTARVSANIVGIQTRRLTLAARECRVFFCDSEATKNDAHTLLGIEPDKLRVIYPGFAKYTV